MVKSTQTWYEMATSSTKTRLSQQDIRIFNTLLSKEKQLPTQKQSFSPFPQNIFFTSQWIVATEIQDFVIKVADQLEHDNMNIGILFKPHPYDKNDYSDLRKNKHIILIDKYEDTFKLFALLISTQPCILLVD